MDKIDLKYLPRTWMDFNFKKLMYHSLKLYESPRFDILIDLEHVAM